MPTNIHDLGAGPLEATLKRRSTISRSETAVQTAVGRLVQYIHSVRYFPGQWRLASALSSLAPAGVAQLRDEQGIRYFVHVGSHVGHSLMVQRRSEPEVASLVPSGRLDTVVDVGANAGTFCLPLARRARRVIAIEADPELCGLLQKTAAANGLRNVRVLNYAITDAHQQFVEFFVAETLKDLSSLDVSALRERDRFVRRLVPAKRLSDVIREETDGKVDVLKIDIEGRSGAALRSLGDAQTACSLILAEPSEDIGDYVALATQLRFRVGQPLRAATDLPDHTRLTLAFTRASD